MTITSDSIRTSTNGDGVTTAFAVSFPFYEDSDLVVLLVRADSTEVLQVLNSDYTVTGGGGAIGTVTMAAPPASGERLVRFRRSPLTQETDYADGDAFPADSHEAALDRLTMQNQEQADKLSRALTLSESTEVAGSLTMAEPVAGRALKWNATEDGIINTDSDLELLEASVAGHAADAAVSRDAAATSAAAALVSQTSAAASAAAASIAAAANLYATIVEKTADFSIEAANNGTLFCVDTSAGDVIVTLPDIGTDVAEGFRIGVVKCAAANAIIINRAGADTINGVTSYQMLADTDFVTLIADQAAPDNWLSFGTSTTLAGPGLIKTGSSVSLKPVVVAAIALGDETSVIAVGTAIVSFHAPIAFTLTDVVAGLVTAQSTGDVLTFDINREGTSILSTKLTIDNTEKISTAATTQAVLSDTAIAAGALLTVDVDQVGSGADATGAKIYLIGYPA